jgi:hypothetical protein
MWQKLCYNIPDRNGKLDISVIEFLEMNITILFLRNHTFGPELCSLFSRYSILSFLSDVSAFYHNNYSKNLSSTVV